MIVLGIETSCDETSAAVVRDGVEVQSNVVASQADLHATWGGVVPEVASRKHLEATIPVVFEALSKAGVALDGVNGIAVTNRPGLIGALLVGVAAAKAIGYALSVPVVGVHHLSGHLHANLLARPNLEFPFLLLLVSGGHTQIILARGWDDLSVLGSTRDDAAGECLDKSARLLGLGYPGGPAIERAALSGRPGQVSFPQASLGDSLDFSFSGLKTAVLRFTQQDGGRTPSADVAAAVQEAVVGALVRKTMAAAVRHGIGTVAIGGGVAANRLLRARLQEECRQYGLDLVAPALDLCTDNAAMIAAAGTARLMAGANDLPLLDTFASAPL